MTVFCRWNVLVRIKARALQLVGIVDQRSVLVQDLFDAEDDCRDLSCDDSARNLEFGSPRWPHFPWQQLFPNWFPASSCSK
jgi:hypothetical protein